jgi:hypothetical protein
MKTFSAFPKVLPANANPAGGAGAVRGWRGSHRPAGNWTATFLTAAGAGARQPADLFRRRLFVLSLLLLSFALGAVWHLLELAFNF